MSLTYGFKNVRDLFEKLKRDAKKLEYEVSSDNLFNFIVTAYHIKNWIKNSDSNSVSNEIKSMARNLPANETIINICQDIANGSKHLKLDEIGQCFQVISEVTSKQGFGQGRHGKGKFGNGEEEIIIKTLPTSDDPEVKELNIIDFNREVVEFWQNFFG